MVLGFPEAYKYTGQCTQRFVNLITLNNPEHLIVVLKPPFSGGFLWFLDQAQHLRFQEGTLLNNKSIKVLKTSLTGKSCRQLFMPSPVVEGRKEQ